MSFVHLIDHSAPVMLFVNGINIYNDFLFRVVSCTMNIINSSEEFICPGSSGLCASQCFTTVLNHSIMEMTNTGPSCDNAN